MKQSPNRLHQEQIDPMHSMYGSLNRTLFEMLQDENFEFGDETLLKDNLSVQYSCEEFLVRVYGLIAEIVRSEYDFVSPENRLHLFDYLGISSILTRENIINDERYSEGNFILLARREGMTVGDFESLKAVVAEIAISFYDRK